MWAGLHLVLHIRTYVYTNHMYTYDVIIVSRYAKYMRMHTNLAGSIAAHATCLSNELCIVHTNCTGWSQGGRICSEGCVIIT